MVGYQPNAKAYRLWDPARHKIFTSRDVIFNLDKNSSQKGAGNTSNPIAENDTQFATTDDSDWPGPEDNSTSMIPPIQPTAPCWKWRTELEMLGPVTNLGKRIPKPSCKIQEQTENPVPEPIAEPPPDLTPASPPEIPETNDDTQEDTLGHLACSLASSQLTEEPCTHHEAMSQPDAVKWEESVQREFAALQKNNVLRECELPPG
ncbi:hypothetical protein BS47DRAFT_1390914 [Hydnum rufescens UP504]|uniref:Retroviral polymerase SH3-like domain-containing protein n=1 Tax=Hydnum rufescens UP504 TaxID=1448309 RepID=A0A9P6DWE0_9AGAM|nr:hypothetical protein BS47DRAFT_1390914 [Hydnum rufescens UP504]